MELCAAHLHFSGSWWYFVPVASIEHRASALRSRAPKDKPAARKLGLLMANSGLSPELLGAQTGVSGKRIRQILDEGHEPQRRVKYALARRFDLLPADIWKSDMAGLTPGDIEHLRQLARRQEAIA